MRFESKTGKLYAPTNNILKLYLLVISFSISVIILLRI